MIFNIYTFAAIIAFIFGSALAYFVGRDAWHNPSRRSFSFVTQLAALWCLFPLVASFNSKISLLLVRFIYITGVLVPPFILQFIFDVSEDHRSTLKKVILGPVYGISVCCVFFVFHPEFILNVKNHGQLFVFIPGKIFHLFVAYYISICLISFLVLIQKLKKIERKNRTKLQYVAIASMIGIFSPILHFSSSYLKWEPFPHDVFFIIYSSIIAYAIVRHKLMDIDVIIKRTAVFASLFAFAYGIFVVTTVIGQEFFKNILGWNQWISMIPSILLITLALRPLETCLTNVTEKFLFQKKYNYRDLLKTFTNEALTVLNLQELMQETVKSLVRIIKLESAAVLLWDKELQRFTLVAASGVVEGVSFGESDLFVSYLKKTGQPILKDKTADQMEGGELKESFKKLNAQLCIPIELHDHLIGILCLGIKKSGEEYTLEDVDILSTLARTEAIAISNAQLFDELSKTQAEAAQREKMAVIGTLAAGINHEICNPLGIVRGQCEMFLLNNRDGFYAGKTADELLQISSDIMTKVIKETDRATAITKKLSGFAKPSKVIDLDTVMVEKELDEVRALIGHELELDNITIEKKFPENFPAITADRKQIQEVLFNIIRNAAQAMDKKEGHVLVSGVCENSHVIIKISDNGSGIPPEKIGQIFNPFYTTKAPGKGTGLGLFIVRQVVERNKGSIAVESEMGAGTTFTLKFPVAHAAEPAKAF